MMNFIYAIPNEIGWMMVGLVGIFVIVMIAKIIKLFHDEYFVEED